MAGEVAGGFTVPYGTIDGTAKTADADYAAATGTLTFAGTAGETQTITVAVAGDTLVEDDETFTVTLGMPSKANVTASDDSGLGTIRNDDSATIAIDDVSKPEGNAGTTDFVFTVTLTGDVAGGFTVPYGSVDGTAETTDADYAAATGTLTFAGTNGETRTIAVAVAGDTVVESNETFTVDLGAPSLAAVTASDGSGLGTIQNDDESPLLVATLEVSSFVSPFDRVEYRLQITNLGSGDQLDDPASDELEDVLPPGLQLESAASDTPGFDVTVDTAANTVRGNGSVAPGATVTVTIEARHRGGFRRGDRQPGARALRRRPRWCQRQLRRHGRSHDRRARGCNACYACPRVVEIPTLGGVRVGGSRAPPRLGGNSPLPVTRSVGSKPLRRRSEAPPTAQRAAM